MRGMKWRTEVGTNGDGSNLTSHGADDTVDALVLKHRFVGRGMDVPDPQSRKDTMHVSSGGGR